MKFIAGAIDKTIVIMRELTAFRLKSMKTDVCEAQEHFKWQTRFSCICGRSEESLLMDSSTMKAGDLAFRTSTLEKPVESAGRISLCIYIRLIYPENLPNTMSHGANMMPSVKISMLRSSRKSSQQYRYLYGCIRLRQLKLPSQTLTSTERWNGNHAVHLWEYRGIL